MYAIFQTGGKQYRAEPNDVLDIELIPGQPGEIVEFSDVLFVHQEGNARVGAPFVSGTRIRAQILGNVKGEKKVIFRYKRRKNQRRKAGHRQNYARIRILEIA